jgi:hypothetical protein
MVITKIVLLGLGLIFSLISLIVIIYKLFNGGDGELS